MLNNKNNTKPLISIIMPCYSCNKYINKSVSKIMNQKTLDKYDHIIKIANYSKIELIMINDGSDDDNKTLNYLKKLRKKYTNIRVISLNKNIGQAQARNIGISKANGTYIGFVDADDDIEENLFLNVFNAIEKYNFPDIICWGTNELHYDKKNQLAKKVTIVPQKKYCMTHKELVRTAIKLEDKDLFRHLQNKIYKKDIITKNQIYLTGENFIDNIVFNIDVFKYSNTMYCLDKAFCTYSITQIFNSNTTLYSPVNFGQYSKQIQKLINWLIEEEEYNKKNKTLLANIYIRYAFSGIWKNCNKNLNISKKEKIKWLDEFFEHPVTKDLLEYINPNSTITKINSIFFKAKLKRIILTEANFIEFIKNLLNK